MKCDRFTAAVLVYVALLACRRSPVVSDVMLQSVGSGRPAPRLLIEIDLDASIHL